MNKFIKKEKHHKPHSPLLLSLIVAVFFISINKRIYAGNWSKETVFQSKREIQIVKSVDVVVVGGTVPAVSAAVAAANQGARVFLIAPHLYLGEDLCATLRLKRNQNSEPKTEIEKQIFGTSNITTPLRVKATLNKVLQEANVEFVFGSFVTDVIWNGEGNPSGVVIANRAGRQAIVAKSIIDATDRAWVCRMAGAEAQSWNGPAINFQRIIVLPAKNRKEPVYENRKIKIPMSDLSFTSFAHAEQIARETTYTEGQLRASESLFYIPPDPIVCNKNEKEWLNETHVEIGHFQPKGFNNLFILSGSAGFPRTVADSILQSGTMASIGERIGKEAARVAFQSSAPNNLFQKSVPVNSIATGDVKEILNGLRPTDTKLPSITSPNTGIPVLGDYDVVVVGGGTAGAPAAIAAARWGLRVLVVEYQEGLGGTGTVGLIGRPWYGRKDGFAAEVPFPRDNIEPKMEWYRAEIKKAGGDIWLGVLGCGVYMEGNQVKGAVVATPEGRGVVRAKVVIDATGNADVAIAAGANYRYGSIEKNQIALQGTGLPSRPLQGNYKNTDYLLVDESDMIDVWQTLVSVHQTKFAENVYDAGSLIQNRERRRIVGDFTMTYLDQIAGRTYPDAIVLSDSDYDSHGYPTSLFFALLPHDEVSKKQNHPAPGGICFTPYRCLLPQGLEGILVVGLAISMERDATAQVRMQLDIANQGYAAGIASAMAVTSAINPRNINVRELQQHLVIKGNIPESFLKMEDSFPLSQKVVKQAVKKYGQATNPENAGKSLAIILSHKKKSLPLISKKYWKATGKSKLLYAQVLGMCEENDGVPTLLAELGKFEVWDEKIFQGSMADYANLPTPIDAIVLALGYSGDKTVLPQLLNLVEKLDTSVTLSHHRSVALALEHLADPAAAQTLAQLLQKPGMQGHAVTNLDAAMTELENDGKGKQKRTRALREIILARALYQCGDFNGTGEKILTNYTNDLRGLFARHAYAILRSEN